jgi:hypothetical protein
MGVEMAKSVLAYVLALISFFIIFGQFFYTITPLDLIFYLDELVIVVFVLLVLFDFVQLSMNNVYLRLGVAMIIFLATSHLSPYFQMNSLAVLGAIIHLKLFIVIFLFARIFDRKEYIIRKLLYVIVVFSILGLIVNLFLQDSFNHFFDSKVDYRNGLLRLIGFNVSSNNLAFFASLIWLYICFARDNVRPQQIVLYTVLLVVLLFVLLGARTPLMVVILGLLLHVFATGSAVRNLALILVTVPVALGAGKLVLFFSGDLIAITLDNISNINEDTTYIRGRMIYHGFELATKFFPFGSGLNTFGTKMSEGSTVYDDVGLSGHYRVSEGVGIYDSNMASIIGELGFLGVSVMFYLLYVLYRYFARRSPKKLYYAALTISIGLFSLTSTPLMSGVNAVMYAIFYILPLSGGRGISMAPKNVNLSGAV